jgi:hypothetical protein
MVAFPRSIPIIRTNTILSLFSAGVVPDEIVVMDGVGFRAKSDKDTVSDVVCDIVI